MTLAAQVRTPLLAMRGVVKSFGGAQALRGVDFDLQPGEVHALLGENGAGKSTLMNVLSGVIEPDAGELQIDGAAVRFSDPRDAQGAGVATIFQELDLVSGLDVTANLFLGREITTGRVLNRAAMRRAARARIEALLSLSSVLTTTMMVSAGWGLTGTLLAVMAVGTAFGAVQGTISTRFRLEPFSVTLAGLQVARGLALVISGNQYIDISYGDGPGLAPPIFSVLGDRLFNNTVPVATLVFVVAALVATFVLNFTRFGRYVFAVGGNEKAARLSGVPVTTVKIAVYAITGLVSATAGIVHAGQFNFGSANDGTGYELTAIAAVVIGGTSLFGGAGSMVGTVAGAVMLGAPANILQLNNTNAALQPPATGAIIVLAAVLQSLVRRREGLGR